AEEAARERKMRVSDDRDPEPVVRTLYRVRHDLVMVGRAAVKPLPPPLLGELGPLLSTLRQDAGVLVSGVRKNLVERKAAPALDDYLASARTLAQAVEALSEDRKRLPGEETARLFTLRFALEQLGEDMRDLASRTTEMSKPHSGPSASPSSG